MLQTLTAIERNLQLFGTEAPVVLVTGSAAPRVGRYVAEHFLQQGFRVVFHAHHASAENQALLEQTLAQGYSATLVSGAVEEEAVVAGWVQHVSNAFGRLDVLVNSAATWQPVRLEAATAADFESSFRVNTLGTALCCKYFGLLMTQQVSGGAIINIGDWATQRPYRNFSPYLLSKAGIETLTHTMAIELAFRNPRVRVNAVLPGPIMLAEGLSRERRERIIAASLLKRQGTADDLAHAVLFLATSPFVTGVCLPVDGGRSIWANDSGEAIAHPSVPTQEGTG